ncbi:hypothetical protein MMC11_001351 [Xylographa trunciseda]|nr:hypothetical protein [Xylographa trunciseda]
MAAQVVLPTPTQVSPTQTISATITLPPSFEIHSQDDRLNGDTKSSPAPTGFAEPLGVLANFTGNFAGPGFNTIFRPNSGTTTFPNPVNLGGLPNDNILELNLTTESLSFSGNLGSVPNRGLAPQSDIFLNGVPYLQAVSDVTNTATGQADGEASQIHLEPGLWMHVPATSSNPVLGESLVRMASIPHGTTINAQCLAPTTSFAGPPDFTQIPTVDITPFVTSSSNTIQKITFPSQTASNPDSPRLPQDLTKFIAAGTITQAILDNPNTVLGNAIQGQTITNTTVFEVTTVPAAPELGGGIANVAFLQGATTIGPNANATQMSATFWIEEVQTNIEVPVFKPGQPSLVLQGQPTKSGAQVPTFVVDPPHEIKAPTTIAATFTQIQYIQTVFLVFAGLTWPHVSCATLIPTAMLSVPASAWN